MSEDKVIQKLLEHDERFDRIEKNMVTKTEIGGITDTLEEIVTIVKRLDQERIFTAEWVKRIEREVEQHSREITKMKQVLKIA